MFIFICFLFFSPLLLQVFAQDIYESPHPYTVNYNVKQYVYAAGASHLTISFDSQTFTEFGYDFITLCKEEACADNWGRYSGESLEPTNAYPGVTTADMTINSDHLYIWLAADADNVDWGYKVTVTPRYWFPTAAPTSKPIRFLSCRFRMANLYPNNFLENQGALTQALKQAFASALNTGDNRVHGLQLVKEKKGRNVLRAVFRVRGHTDPDYPDEGPADTVQRLVINSFFDGTLWSNFVTEAGNFGGTIPTDAYFIGDIVTKLSD